MPPADRKLPLPVTRCLDTREDADAQARIWAGVQARRTQRGGHTDPPTGRGLPLPLGEALRPSYTDELVAERTRMWQSIQARRQGPARPTPIWRAPAFAMGVAVTALAVAVVGVQQGSKPQGASLLAQHETTSDQISLEVGKPVIAPVSSASGPLFTAAGQHLETVEATDRPLTVRMADRSELRLREGARVEPLLSNGTRFEILLTDGTAEFDVTPNGPRRWVIQAGLATVEVVGTRFRVERSPQLVRVFVHHGIVLVRSEQLPDRVRRLTDGESIEVRGDEFAEVGGRLDEEPELGLTAESAVAYVPPKASPNRWRKHARAGQYRAAFRALGKSGIRREANRARTVEQLLLLADVARLSGHPQQAVKPLERILARHANSGHAALAAFTLGRLFLEQVKRPAKAAAAFEKAIRMRPPSALLADCHARLVEAHARAGDKEAARRAADRYRSLFPHGRHLRDVERWTR